MRYSVREVLLDEDHPQFPGQTVFKLEDSEMSRVSLGCYTSKEVAEGIAERKNNA